MYIATVMPTDASPPCGIVRRRPRPKTDRNQHLLVLSVLCVYVIFVHHALKFTSFLIPDNSPSKEELLSSLRRSVAGNQKTSSPATSFFGLHKDSSEDWRRKKGQEGLRRDELEFE